MRQTDSQSDRQTDRLQCLSRHHDPIVRGVATGEAEQAIAWGPELCVCESVCVCVKRTELWLEGLNACFSQLVFLVVTMRLRTEELFTVLHVLCVFLLVRHVKNNVNPNAFAYKSEAAMTEVTERSVLLHSGRFSLQTFLV